MYGLARHTPRLARRRYSNTTASSVTNCSFANSMLEAAKGRYASLRVTRFDDLAVDDLLTQRSFEALIETAVYHLKKLAKGAQTSASPFRTYCAPPYNREGPFSLPGVLSSAPRKDPLCYALVAGCGKLRVRDPRCLLADTCFNQSQCHALRLYASELFMY